MSPRIHNVVDTRPRSSLRSHSRPKTTNTPAPTTHCKYVTTTLQYATAARKSTGFGWCSRLGSVLFQTA
ncbi:hypothetical protein E4U54_001129 [Claviceps lovelessii]|nr:hypothetical protein E4U54_001129 [Claviceps lovelessii]